MGFLVNKITGNGTAHTAITNDATLEAVVNSLVAYNTTGGALSFSLLINDEVIFSESVAANKTFRLPDKVNLGASDVLKVNAATGVVVTVSYLQQALDVAGALSAAQQAALDATINGAAQVALAEAEVLAAQAAADRAEAALGDNSNPIITGSITEQVYNLTGTAISPANGTIQYKTVSANTTFTETLTSGQSVILRLIGANGKTITFPTITWIGVTAPTLTANCAIVLWKEQSTLYGAYVGTLA